VSLVKEGSVTASSCFCLVDPVCFIRMPFSVVVIILFVLEGVVFIFVISQKTVELLAQL